MAKAPWYLKIKQLPPVKTDDGYKLFVNVSVSKIYIYKLKIIFYFYFAIAYIKKRVFRLSIESETNKMLNIIK